MSSNVQRYFPVLLILTVTSVLYGGFLYSPVVFDDIKFFQNDSIERITQHFNMAVPRALPYWTLAISKVWFGDAILPLRIMSLLLHVLTGLSLYVFLRQVQGMVLRQSVGSNAASIWLPLFGALVFVVHPVAVYGAAYLIQRSIVMATLFALWSWWCALQALKSGQQRWVWLSVGAYALSAFSKEHAVMVPVVSIMLALWWWRTTGVTPGFADIAKRYGVASLACIAVAAYLVLCLKGVLGKTYEFDMQPMRADVVPQPAWALSVLTQGWLFFKYLSLWLLPNPLWMSADMREPFAVTLHAWPQAMGLVSFLLWAGVGGLFLWRGGRPGLLGFAMLAPWLLFATELMTVRYHEIFVLYRSYLWLAPTFVVFLLFEGRLSRLLVIALLVVVPIMLAPLTWNRLMSFSHPFYLWNDAVRLARDKADVSGVDRIFANRGVELHKLKRYDLAITDFTTAIHYNPRFSPAYGGRASALAASGRQLQALPDFAEAIRLDPGFPVYRANQGKALASLERFQEASESFQAACDIGWKTWCDTAKELQEKALVTPAPAS